MFEEEIDLTGKRFGKLLVLEKIPEKYKGYTYYVCLCDCGKVTRVEYISLVSGNTKSCGCLLYTSRSKGYNHVYTRKRFGKTYYYAMITYKQKTYELGSFWDPTQAHALADKAFYVREKYKKDPTLCIQKIKELRVDRKKYSPPI